ncbi:MAG TPA: MarR family transcriptional regulator [Gaiellaceae bacterium]|nr:MarR family transcriptional regulator [Gaiellaceae bacterium]
MTSHALTLLEVSKTPDVTVRDLARRTNLTERQTHRVLDDLVKTGYIKRMRVGRRNHYSIDPSRPMRDPSFAHHRVDSLLGALCS